MRFEIERAAGLLAEGRRSVRQLQGWGKVGVAGYVAGGRPPCRRCGRPSGDVLARSARPSRRTTAIRAVGLLASRRSARVSTHRAGVPGLRADHPDQARNFYYGIRLLPPDKRAALCALYALARRIDDIGDGDLTRRGQGRRRSPESARTLQAGPTAADPVLVAVADAARRFPVPLGAFDELVDGVEMDLGDVRHRRLRRTRRVLPVRGRLGRPAVPVDLRQQPPRPAGRRCTPTRSASPCSRPTSCATSARTSATAGSTCRSRSWTGTACELRVDERGALADPDGRLAASSGTPPDAPATGTRSACGCCRCWTGAARRAAGRWPASTASCWSRIAGDPVSCTTGGCRWLGRQKARRRRARRWPEEDGDDRPGASGWSAAAWRASPRHCDAPTRALPVTLFEPAPGWAG